MEEVLSVGKPFAFFTDTCFEVDSCFHVVENLKNTGELNKLELNVWLHRCRFCLGMKLEFFSRVDIIK